MIWNTTQLRPVQTHGRKVKGNELKVGDPVYLSPAEFPQEGRPQLPVGPHRCHCVRISFVIRASPTFVSK